MTPIIKVEDLSKKYMIGHASKERYSTLRDSLAQLFKKTSEPKEEFFALDGVNFEVREGERVGIIGRNGAGKSTLLKLLSRITEPTTGRITLRGKVASLLEVGTGFHPELSGRENIYLNGAILGMNRAQIKKKFDEIVAFAEVEKFLDTAVKRYSSGMYVRLAFAVAAHLEPEILIVDEVLAVGDAQFQQKCLGKMEDVSKSEGRTILFVSHNMGVIAQLCERAILLGNGQLIEDGPTRKVIDKYILNIQKGGSVYRKRESESPIYFEEIATVNAKGEPTEVFDFNESILLKVRIRSTINDPNAKVSVTFQNNNGDFLSTIVESIDQFRGERIVKFTPAILTPKAYAFRLAVFHHNARVYDLVEMVCPFSILETGSKMSEYEGVNYGNFFIDYKLC